MLLVGDMNARVGPDSSPDTHIPILEDLIPSFCSSFDVPPRSACDRTTNQYGKKLNALCNNLDLFVANGRIPGDLFGNFTSFTSRGCSTVDLIIASRLMLKNIQKMKINPPEFSSVHSPVSVTFNCQVSLPNTQKESVPLSPKICWDPSKANEFRLGLQTPGKKAELDALLNSISIASKSSDIDISVYSFNDYLVSAAKKCMKISKPGRKQKRQNKLEKGPKWFDKVCSAAKRRLQNLAKLLVKNPKDPFVRGKYILVKKEFRRAIKNSKRAHEMDIVKNLEEKASDPKLFWSFLKGIGKDDTDPASPTLDEWFQHFSALNEKDPSTLSAQDERVANLTNSLRERLQAHSTHNDILTAPCELQEVAKCIDSLKSGKAVATDNISNEIIKASKDIIAPFIVSLFNKIIEHEIFPEAWALGLILPLFKSGDTLDVNCYRGITINSCLSKLFMLILNNRLQSFCDQKNVIRFNQIGFRKSFRSADHIFTLKTLIDQSFDDGEPLHVCFVDFKKAYDSVWRDGLFLKLLDIDANPKFVRLLKNIYSSSSLAVKIPGGRSTIFPSNVGLKQGCNLSPLLFNIFINDFLTQTSIPFTHSPLLKDIPINALMYADDLVLMSKSEDGLQNLLDMLQNFTESWFLQVNKTKTKCVHFSKTKFTPKKQFKFGTDHIESTESYCYLGVTFTQNGSLNEASRVLHSKSLRAMYGLLRKVHKHKSCNPNILLELFDKTILPIALYGSEIWGTMCLPYNPRNNDLLNIKSSKNLVEDLQYRFCKRILKEAR